MPATQTAAITDETDLVFAGFAVFLDPPKASAGATIQAMAEAGVAVKVLTGDNELVTRHVFAEIGVPVTGVLTGEALTQLSDEALIGQLPRVNLFCRVNPQQKHRILLALKRLGNVVGFMGDGINDAPALHAADVGISVDGAADVARAAADLILLEHDLSVVREAVLCGRSTVQNVTKYVLMGSSSNFGNMFSMAGAALFLPFLPMLPIQILLNNLLYDVSEIAIPFDRVDPEAIARPVKWDIKLIERFMLVFGPVSSIFDFLTFYALLHLFGAGEALFQTGWFIESITTQVLVVFAIRTRRQFFRSRPHGLLVAMALGTVAVAVAAAFPADGWLVRFRCPTAAVFRLPGQRDRGVSGARRDHQARFLPIDRRALTAIRAGPLACRGSSARAATAPGASGLGTGRTSSPTERAHDRTGRSQPCPRHLTHAPAARRAFGQSRGFADVVIPGREGFLAAMLRGGVAGGPGLGTRRRVLMGSWNVAAVTPEYQDGVVRAPLVVGCGRRSALPARRQRRAGGLQDGHELRHRDAVARHHQSDQRVGQHLLVAQSAGVVLGHFRGLRRVDSVGWTGVGWIASGGRRRVEGRLIGRPTITPCWRED